MPLAANNEGGLLADERPTLGARLADLRTEEHRYYLENQRQLWLSGKEWALTTVRLLLTVNGGAVIAILASIGAVTKDCKMPFAVTRAALGLSSFCAGVVLATLSAGISTIYFSMLWRALPSTENVEQRTTQLLLDEASTLERFSRNHRPRERAGRFLLLSMGAASLAAICFVAGTGLTASAFFIGPAAAPSAREKSQSPPDTKRVPAARGPAPRLQLSTSASGS